MTETNAREILLLERPHGRPIRTRSLAGGGSPRERFEGLFPGKQTRFTVHRDGLIVVQALTDTEIVVSSKQETLRLINAIFSKL